MPIRLASCVVLVLCLVPHAKAGWIHDVHAPSAALPATSSLRYDTASDVGTPHLGDALLALTDAGSAGLDILVLHERVLEADFQQELFLRLRASAPSQLDDALGSSGNHDNPALLALRRPFLQVVSDSRVVAGYRQDLARHRLRVADVQLEKLTLGASGDAPRLRCFLWLTPVPM